MPSLTHPDGRRKTVHKSATARIAALVAGGFVLDDAKPAAKKAAKKAAPRKATKSAAPTPEQKPSNPEANPDPESTED